MDELAARFSEVLVAPADWTEAEGLSPIYSRDLLGNKAMIFEGTSAAKLADLGEVSTPSVADLFVAKLQTARGIK